MRFLRKHEKEREFYIFFENPLEFQDLKFQLKIQKGILESKQIKLYFGMFIEDDYIEEMMQKREGQEPSGLNKYSKRPKLKINKLSDERRSVALQVKR